MIHHRRSLATALTILFLAASLSPLVGASTEQTFNGDVVVNGAFTDARPMGHPLKANDPATTWAAYDWATTSSPGATGAFVLGEQGGITFTKTAGDTSTDVGLQQYFSGSYATSRAMRFFSLSLTANATEPGTYVSAQIRYDDSNKVRTTASKTILLTSSMLTYKVSAADLGLQKGESYNLVSFRLLASGLDKPVHVDRVSVFATNGVEGRNIHIVPTGDDSFAPLGEAGLVSPGRDGKYSFLVGMAADNGDFLYTQDATVCLYDAEQAIADRGYPSNNGPGGMCADAFVKPASAAVTKTRAGNALRFDIDAKAVQSATSDFAAFALYATVFVDGTYDRETPQQTGSEAKSGYFNALRLAADRAGFNVSQEYPFPTPLFVDSDSDGKPDSAQFPESDGYSVIITPLRATSTPLATIVTPDLAGNYRFDVQVYNYTGGALGVPMTLERGIAFGLFGGEGLASGSVTTEPFWQASSADMTFSADRKTVHVTVPGAEVPTSTPFGAEGFYFVDMGAPATAPATAPVFGKSNKAFDFYSALRNSVKEHAVSEGFRSAMTPILADGAAATKDATVVVRMPANDDSLSVLDGALLAGDRGDGVITFEYAMLDAAGVRVPSGGQHGFALYDAGGIASDDLQPGSRKLAHAEFVAKGVAQPDGWFRVEAPLSAFASAKGPVGAWAYVDDVQASATTSRSGWFNLLKPSVAQVSTSVAERALYAPTPIVALDSELGIPQMLKSALAGAPTGGFSVTNPLVNPGFEVDLLVEGVHENRDMYSAAMTSPPWFMRLDDSGTGQATDAASVHEVAPGAGQLGDAALRVQFKTADRGKGLMLGQLLGTDPGRDALAWKGATGASFDLKTTGSRAVAFTAAVRWVDDTGAIRVTTGSVNVPAFAAWKRVDITFSQPATGELLGFFLLPDSVETTTFYLDNIVLKGARTVLGDARSDLTDGFAVVVQPRGLTGNVQGTLAGAAGGFYVYDVTVMDYTNGRPAKLDTSALSRTFALRTPDLELSTGTILSLRGVADRFVAVVPQGDVPAPAAAPWAWVDAGAAYSSLDLYEGQHPASGYYNPVKNAIAGSPVADQLDYGATPVVFGGASAGSLVVPQQLRVFQSGADYGVRVESGSSFVESTTVTVSKGGANTTYPVTLDDAAGNIVAGLVISSSDLGQVTITSAPTLFSTGARIVQGSPIASFEVCRPDLAGCVDTGILTNELLTFRSTTLSPAGEPLTSVWNFSDGTTVTTTNASVAHAFAKPGSHVVNLTVFTPTGKKASALETLLVGNRAPVIAGVDVSPAQIYTNSFVTARVRATDADKGVLGYSWSLDGIPLAAETRSTVSLTAAHLEAATGKSTLQKRAYSLGATVTDGQGGVTTSLVTFTVADRPVVVARPVLAVPAQPNATFAVVGESVRVTTTATDADDVIASASALFASPTESVVVPLAKDAAGAWTGEASGLPAGAYVVTVTAMNEAGATGASPGTEMLVRANTAPVITAIGGPTLLQGDRSATFVANATDPEGRALAYAWTLDGTVALPSGRALTLGPLAGMADFALGTHVLTLTVTDAQGLATTSELSFEVDDFVSAAVAVSTTGTSDPATVTVTVTDAFGAPVAGARVDLRDHYGPIQAALANATLVTDASGKVVWKVPGLLPGVEKALPFDHRLVVDVVAASLAGAPVQDAETAHVEVVYSVNPLPTVTLPLA